MKRSFIGNIYRQFGLHVRANKADEDREESRLLVAEHRKPENQRPRKVSYEEIMCDLVAGAPGRFMDRKIQAYMSGDLWPPRSLDDNFVKVQAKGINNAWSTSVRSVEKLIMLSHMDVYQSMLLEFGPFAATCEIDGTKYRVRGGSAAMTLMMLHLLAGRLRYDNDDGTASVGSCVEVLTIP